MKDEKEKNIFHSISSFFSSFFPDAILGWSLNQPKKKKGSSWRLTILPYSIPLSPVLPSLQIKIFLLILHPPFLKGLGRVEGKKNQVQREQFMSSPTRWQHRSTGSKKLKRIFVVEATKSKIQLHSFLILGLVGAERLASRFSRFIQGGNSPVPITQEAECGPEGIWATRRRGTSLSLPENRKAITRLSYLWPRSYIKQAVPAPRRIRGVEIVVTLSLICL